MPIVALTLFDPADWLPWVPDPLADAVGFTLLEMLANIALFVPLGIVLGAWWPRRGAVVLVGVALSVTIEVIQLGLDDRVSDPVDVAMNSLGTIGGFVAVRVAWSIVASIANRRSQQ